MKCLDYITAQRQDSFHEFNTRSHRIRELSGGRLGLFSQNTQTPLGPLWPAEGLEAALPGPSHPCPALPGAGLSPVQISIVLGGAK